MTALRTLLISISLALAAFAFAPPASAGDPVIDAAISSGTVGERIDARLPDDPRSDRQLFFAGQPPEPCACAGRARSATGTC